MTASLSFVSKRNFFCKMCFAKRSRTWAFDANEPCFFRNVLFRIACSTFEVSHIIMMRLQTSLACFACENLVSSESIPCRADVNWSFCPANLVLLPLLPSRSKEIHFLESGEDFSHWTAASSVSPENVTFMRALRAWEEDLTCRFSHGEDVIEPKKDDKMNWRWSVDSIEEGRPLLIQWAEMIDPGLKN